MAETQRWQAIPTRLELTEFEQFVLPHLVPDSRGPAPKLSLYKIFNYVSKILYLGCQWKELPIDKNDGGKPEIHDTRIYRIWRRWVEMGCIDAILDTPRIAFHTLIIPISLYTHAPALAETRNQLSETVSNLGVSAGHWSGRPTGWSTGKAG
jgi:hypothetical protein